MRALVGFLVLFLAPAASAGPVALPVLDAAGPGPGIFCDLSEPITGRLFPEPEQTNDFVSYDEALCGLDRLAEDYSDRVRVVKIGESVGWESLAGGHDSFDVFVVEVTRFDSALAFEDKPKLVFQLSIHGNEKGAREGGLRVIEDFARDLGLAQERPDLANLLDLVALVFVFPNPDGWTHEEPEYRLNDACYFSATCGSVTKPGEPGVETQGFVRVNGHGADVNREFPTAGWQDARYTALSEPEAIAVTTHLKAYRNVRLASDIHGMLNPADATSPADCLRRDAHLAPAACDPKLRGHFVLTMLPAGRLSPREGRPQRRASRSA